MHISTTLTFLPKTLRILLFSTLISASNLSFAVDVNYHRSTSPDEKFSSTEPHNEKIFSLPKTVQLTAVPVQRIKITPQQLQNQLALLTQLLSTSLARNDMQGVSILLPVYEKLTQKQPHLLLWAQAMMAYKEGDIRQAIQGYRGLISQQPKLTSARFQLAILLFKDQQNEAAQDQFNRLRAEMTAPQPLAIIEQYQQALLEREQWNFTGGLTYLYETNVNNAPKQHRVGNWINNERPESAQGVGYQFQADKRWMLKQGWYLPFSFNGRGKYYWNNHKYDELSIRTGIGLGYQNSHSQISLTPFAERFWYAGGSGLNSQSMHRYSRSNGLNLNAAHWLNHRWKVETEIEYGVNRYHFRTDLNGHYWDTALSLLYLPNSQQYWFINLGKYHKSAVKKSNSFDLNSISVGWGQEWNWGISTRLSFSYSQRHYHAPLVTGTTVIPIPNFYRIPQKNNEYVLNLTLWHRAVHFYGITPKLTWTSQWVNSNNPFASYQRNRINLTFTKTF